jgi:hypothetical protein
MLAKRRRRQEEESLVPHGLIWQATAEDTAPEKSTPSGALPKTRVTEIGKLPAPAPIDSVHTSETPKKPAANSPPPFWRSQRGLEVVKSKAASPVSDINPDSAPVMHAQAHQNKINSGVLAHPRVSRTVHELLGSCQQRASDSRKFIAAVAANFLLWMKGLRQRGTAVIRRTSERARTGAGELHLNSGLRRGVNWRSAELQVSAKHLRLIGTELKIAGRSLLKKSSAYLGLYSRRVHSISLPDISQRTMATMAKMHERFASPSAFKMRVRLAGLPLQARILFTQRVSEWKLKSKLGSADSRLWTSMTLGAGCALLALGLVSAGRHYADGSLPSHVLRSNAPPPASTSTEVETAKPIVTAPKEAAVTRTSLRQKSIPPAVSNQQHLAESRPKPRHHESDEYVARDTTVYYGEHSRKSQ